ncbi:potassium channel family protein [Lelliottia sp. WAP21]|uniref:potassium channel family protein n=1 Tax=Lelliottia sp. WAP21 TaxID=2877426 RepID=UPI001E304F15|nr:potassium channel family protein [Lelliottia sp. WAP21]
MAANFFSLQNNEDLHSQNDFFCAEEDNRWSSINYYPSFFGSDSKAPLIIKSKVFNSISFKDTTFENVNFINCVFHDCLFIGSVLNNCEVIDCKFYNTNTHKIKIRGCLINPKQFDANFDLKYDANIAVDLFQELYRNSKIEEQPKYSNDSLYKMNVALGYNLNYKYKSRKINLLNFLYEKAKDIINRVTTGYGLKIGRILLTVFVTVFFMAILNFNFKDGFTTSNGHEIRSFIDAFYFTCVTVTTLGYGDITPSMTITKIIVIVESLVGFVFMSLFVSAFINRVLRS